jgi:lysozyme family protein
MNGAFDRAVALVLEREGGYLDPKQAAAQGDRGGETKFGISKAAFPHVDIKNLTPGQAKALYRAEFWERCGGDSLPWFAALLAFDAAVQHGPSYAARLLQRVVGAAEDGQIGPATLKALAKVPADEFVARYQAERILYYVGQKGWLQFGRGWSRRAFHMTSAALAV